MNQSAAQYLSYLINYFETKQEGNNTELPRSDNPLPQVNLTFSSFHIVYTA